MWHTSCAGRHDAELIMRVRNTQKKCLSQKYQRLVRSKRGRAVRGAVVQVDLDAVPRSALHAATDRDAVVVAVQEHLGERPDAPI